MAWTFLLLEEYPTIPQSNKNTRSTKKKNSVFLKWGVQIVIFQSSDFRGCLLAVFGIEALTRALLMFSDLAHQARHEGEGCVTWGRFKSLKS